MKIEEFYIDDSDQLDLRYFVSLSKITLNKNKLVLEDLFKILESIQKREDQVTIQMYKDEYAHVSHRQSVFLNRRNPDGLQIRDRLRNSEHDRGDIAVSEYVRSAVHYDPVVLRPLGEVSVYLHFA